MYRIVKYFYLSLSRQYNYDVQEAGLDLDIGKWNIKSKIVEVSINDLLDQLIKNLLKETKIPTKSAIPTQILPSAN